MSPVYFGWAQSNCAGPCGFVPPVHDGLPTGPVLDEGEGHTVVFAPTGEGKGRNVLIPALLTYEGAAVVVDVKGEAAQVTARRRREMGQEVVVIDPFGVTGLATGSLNPLDLLRPGSEELPDDAMAMAENVEADRKSSRDPFWPEKGKDLIAGLITAVVSDADPAQRTLGSVWRHLASEDTTYGLAVLLDKRGDSLPPYARSQIATFLATAELTRSGILQTALQQARCLGSPVIQRSLATTSFDLARFRDGAAMTIYLVLPPTKLASHAPVLRLWLAVLLGVVAERRRRPKLDTLFLVDELAQIGAIPVIQQAVTLLRGYGLKTALFLQSVAQLRALWPDGYHTILDNCANLVTFGHTSLAASREVCDQLGDVSAEVLFALRADEVAIRRSRKGTVIARKVDYLADPLFRGMADPNPRFL